MGSEKSCHLQFVPASIVKMEPCLLSFGIQFEQKLEESHSTEVFIGLEENNNNKKVWPFVRSQMLDSGHVNRCPAHHWPGKFLESRNGSHIRGYAGYRGCCACSCPSVKPIAVKIRPGDSMAAPYLWRNMIWWCHHKDLEDGRKWGYLRGGFSQRTVAVLPLPFHSGGGIQQQAPSLEWMVGWLVARKHCLCLWIMAREQCDFINSIVSWM